MTLSDTLRTELRAAMRRRDRDAVSVLRATLAAIDNAEAVPADDQPSSSAAVGAGAAEARRRTLTEDDVRAIVRREAEEYRSGAREVRAHDEQRAVLLDAQAAVLEGLLAG